MTRIEWLQRYVARFTAHGYKLAMDVEQYECAHRIWGPMHPNDPETAADEAVELWEAEGDELETLFPKVVGLQGRESCDE